MLLLLPPSESKRPGGNARARLDIDTLMLPSLAPVRRVTADALVALSRSADRVGAARLLGVPRTRIDDLDANAILHEAPVLPALDRYSGVLYDALDAATLPPVARRHLGRTAAVHSAVFGPVGALDRIPDYRMSASSRLPGIRLKGVWAPAVTAALGELGGPIIDLRSESYVALGPVEGRGYAYVRVVAEGPDGARRALNHFNKHAKGTLVRAFALDRPRVRSVRGFADWAVSAGFRLAVTGDRELTLTVD
jgi:cytoplasmic iron level regulating protein YaaA (DUF328/UPF0246 family)